MDEQERIIRSCTHPDKDSEVMFGRSEIVHCCYRCWNESVAARRAARKRELEAMPRCEVPGCKRRATLTVAGSVGMCGQHFKHAETQAQREYLEASGGVLFFAPMSYNRDSLIRWATA